MPKASTDKGFLQLANQLAEQFARRAFKVQHLAILFVVMRCSYGFQRDGYAYTYKQIAEATGIDDSDTRKQVKELLAMGVLREKGAEIGINPNLEQWEIPLRGQGKFPRKSGEIPLRKSGEIPPQEEGKSPRKIGGISPAKKGKFPSETPLNPASGAGSGEAKYNSKEKKENHDDDFSFPKSENATPKPSGYSDDDLTLLEEAAEGLGILGGRDLPLRLRGELAKRAATNRASDAVLDVWDRMPHSEKAVWCSEAMKTARREAKGSLLSFAAAVIANAIEAGRSLVPQSSKVIQMRQTEKPAHPYAGHPWASIWSESTRGTMREGDYVFSLARKVSEVWQGALDIFKAQRLYEQGGVEGAMEYVWAAFVLTPTYRDAIERRRKKEVASG